jgi:hypothetical protein
MKVCVYRVPIFHWRICTFRITAATNYLPPTVMCYEVTFMTCAVTVNVVRRYCINTYMSGWRLCVRTLHLIKFSRAEVPLRTRSEMVLETSVLSTFNHLTRLEARENFIIAYLGIVAVKASNLITLHLFKLLRHGQWVLDSHVRSR